jgi:hypothetical protein
MKGDRLKALVRKKSQAPFRPRGIFRAPVFQVRQNYIK